jgi:hypothetical protein
VVISTQDEIFEWVRGLEPWKQELFRRTSASPDLSAEDLQEIATLLLEGSHASTGPREIRRDELPGADRGSEPMVVRAISDLRNVNAIDDGQKIEFGPNLNVIYGRNGSGKTGYSRILKHGGRTLHRESVLTNVRKGGAGSPSAVVTSTVGGQQDSVKLDLAKPAPASLGRICIADSDACDVYLTSETEVDYIPASLASMRRFTAGLKALDEELDQRRRESTPSPLDTRIFGSTSVARKLDELTEKTPAAEIDALAHLDTSELARKSELTKQRGAIEASEAPRLRVTATRDADAAKGLSDDLGNLARDLGQDRIKTYQEELKELAVLGEAAIQAGKKFEGEPLGEIGSEAWHRLWEAADRYAAHLEVDFPSDHDPDVCPLCMQRLSPEAKERLGRFDVFVRDDVNARLDSAKRAFAGRIKGLPDLDVVSDRHSHTLNLLGRDGGEYGAAVAGWLEGAKELVTAIREGHLEGASGLLPPPDLSDWINDRRGEAQKYAALEKEEDQKAVMVELAELEARQLLTERKEEVINHLNGLCAVAAINIAKGKIGRTSASKKLTDLSRELIEANVQGALNRHLRALDFKGLEVVAKSKSPGGRPKLKLRFRTVDRVPLTAVLSKGEQRRLALAMFLAELEVMADPSPVLFDDPVSSLDQEGRRHVARTLANLAADRQVIIFTHDVSFIFELRRLAPDALSLKVQQLKRQGKTVGHVSPDLPWRGLKAKHRVEPLHKRLATVRKLDEGGEEEKCEVAAIEFCLLLREAFERAVEEEVLGGIVTRRDDAVHVLGLRNICLNEEICDLVERGTNEASPWVHDRPHGDGSVPPTPDELAKGLQVYKQLLAATKNFKKRPEPPPAGLEAMKDEVDGLGDGQLQIVAARAARA